MESAPGTTGDHPNSLAQYEGTFGERKAKLSYASEENEGHCRGALHVRYTDHATTTVETEEAVLINNDQIICVVEKARNAFEIKMVSFETGDVPEQPRRKLVTINATNLPPDFVRDNVISPQFPFLAHVSASAGGEQTSPLYVIISTQSGARQAEDFYSTIVSPLLASGSALERNHTKIVTTTASTVTEFTQETLLKHANVGTPQTLLLLSGDGGIVDVLNALHSSPNKRTPLYQSPTVGLVAMGTGNALAYSAGLSRDRTLGLRHFYRGHPRPLPTFTATFSPGSVFLIDEGRATAPLPTIIVPTNSESESENDRVGIVHGAVVCSWALHASIVADSDTATYRARHGPARFRMAAAELLRPADGSQPHAYSGRVSYHHHDTPTPTSPIPMSSTAQKPNSDADSNDSQSHSYVLAALVSHLEAGFHISPSSHPLDGQLWLLRLGAPMSAEGMEGVLGRAFTDGSHVDDKAVTYESVESVRLEIREREERWRRVCVDGKIVLVSLSESSDSSLAAGRSGEGKKGRDGDGDGKGDRGEWGWVEVRRNKPEESVLSIVA